jgi:hypothetical protein
MLTRTNTPGLAAALGVLMMGMVSVASAEAARLMYLAGRLGFSQADRHFVDVILIPELTRLGYLIVDPFKLTDSNKIGAVNALPT